MKYLCPREGCYAVLAAREICAMGRNLLLAFVVLLVGYYTEQICSGKIAIHYLHKVGITPIFP